MNTKTTTTLIIFLLFLLLSIELLLQSQKPQNSQIPTQLKLNPFNRLHIILNSNNNTLTRIPQFFPKIPPSTTNSSSLSLSKDVTINPNTHTWVRIFIPRNVPGQPGKKLPILVFVHGGGFILHSVASPVFHEFGSAAAVGLRAVVVAVEYRLAPEHRLPAAYDDVLEAVKWVKDGKDEWVEKYGDFKRCVIMGESAGGNMVYKVGLKIADDVEGFKPLIIKGLILVQPFFGGVDRTQSEIRLVNDEALPLVVNDLLWDLSLPIGSGRDHGFCDPFKGDGLRLLDRVREVGWRVWVAGCDGDPLYDRIVEVVKLMEGKGVSVKSMFDRGGYHGMFVSNFTKRSELLDFSKQFLHMNL